jgi:hypothetical protein
MSKSKTRTTRKPCPGCGETDQRDADKVCYACQRLMEDGRTFREAAKRKEKQIVQIPCFAYELPHIGQVGHTTRRQFQQAFFELLVACGKPVPSNCYYNNSEALLPLDYMTSKIGHFMPPRFRKLFRQLYTSVQAMTKQAYSRGERRGQSFLIGLCDGSVSLNELNKATILGGED